MPTLINIEKQEEMVVAFIEPWLLVCLKQFI
jgi:hypothetical protein